MIPRTTGQPRIVSREEWLEARKEHLKSERALMRMRDLVAAERRTLPWVKVIKQYVFDTTEGSKSLADLFGSNSQLLVYHFMLTPGSDHICDGCSLLADHIDSARMHFEHADLSFAAISRAPLSQILPVKKRMGWRFPWASSHGNSFNFDYGVSFTKEQVESGDTGYNYGTTPYAAEDLPGTSVFAKNAAGDVFHTYSSYARGGELLIGAFNFLDLVPKGRNETSIMSWVKLHDEYDAPAGKQSCCHSAPQAKSA
jgi:predicted dithiol-disulfide oxidoreductase (DUF899 family)